MYCKSGTVLVLAAFGFLALSEAGKPGCNIKAIPGSTKTRRQLQQKNKKDQLTGAPQGLQQKKHQLDLTDFDLDLCLKNQGGTGPINKLDVDIQLAADGQTFAFSIEKDPNNTNALRGKRKRGIKGEERIGELNMVTGPFGDMAGSAQMDGTIFHFSTQENGSTCSTEIKLADLPPDDPEGDLEQFHKQHKPNRLLRSNTSVEVDATIHRKLASESITIDVMVPYTQRVLCSISQAGSPDKCDPNDRRKAMVQARIDLAVQETNVAYENSGIPGRLRLVHSYMVENYDEIDLTYSQILTHISTTDGVLDNVHVLRENYGADIVTMLVDNPTSCGLAYIGAPVAKEWAFGAVNWLCATGYYSFAHEIAHNLGGKHDRIAQTCPDPYCCKTDCYNFGWQDPLGRFRSIMSYDCPSGGCVRVQMFSQPQYPYSFVADNTSRQVRIGSSTNNVARIIRESFPIAAAYNAHVEKAPTQSPVSSPHCGNGVCEPKLYENCSTCPQDCIGGIYRGAECGNNICEASENCNNCPADCSMRKDVTREDLKYCCEGGPPENAGFIPYGVSCGTFSYCNFNTQCSTEPQQFARYCCGNGICERGEGVWSCPADCSCKDDGVCDLFEDGTCRDCQNIQLNCMGIGRVCSNIVGDPCCGKCDSVTKKCV